MRARSAVSNQNSDKLASLIPAAFLACGGLLTVAWSCALALCTYDVLCWLLE